jgi:hypothetical protein
VALGFLERDREGWYGNTPETALFLDRAKPSYVGGLLEMANARLYPFWGDLTEALRTGRPQNELKRGGGNAFEALYSDHERLRQFLGAMTGISLGTAQAIAHKFPWGKVQELRGRGLRAGGAARAGRAGAPNLSGGGFDLPPVGPVFEEYVASFGLQGRLRFHPGDFTADGALPAADVLVMGHILHDWDLGEKRALLKKAHAALPPGGALIVYEALIDDERRENAFGLLMSLNMLIETPGGFDFSGADCRGWMGEAGFKETYVETLAGPDAMVVGIK